MFFCFVEPDASTSSRSSASASSASSASSAASASSASAASAASVHLCAAGLCLAASLSLSPSLSLCGSLRSVCGARAESRSRGSTPGVSHAGSRRLLLGFQLRRRHPPDPRAGREGSYSGMLSTVWRCSAVWRWSAAHALVLQEESSSGQALHTLETEKSR